VLGAVHDGCTLRHLAAVERACPAPARAPGRRFEVELVETADEWHASEKALTTEKLMEKRTLEQLEAALDAVSKDLSPRVEELARKSTAGLLTPEEDREYAEVVRLNDMLSLLKLQAEEFWTMRAAS
jgi:hypothetical protein